MPLGQIVHLGRAIRKFFEDFLFFDIQPGDIIVMLSDGIAQSFEESVWLLDLLSCGWDEADDLTTVAEKILAGAAANNARPDDRSVALIRVSERTAG